MAMTVTTVEVSLARSVDAAGMVESLAARGLSAKHRDGHLTLEVGHSRDGLDVTHVLEMCVSEQNLPYIPTPSGDGGFVLRPPAG